MSEFRLSKTHTMSREALRETARSLAERLEAQHGMRAHWQGDDVVAIKGSGLDARLSIDDRQIEVNVRLGFLASPFQGRLRAEIQRYLDDNIS
ncbi:MAG: polyhydroxyalkanoic acid system family protein [Chromatocurvus sp.]